jgi:hypothetical protein
VFALILGGDTRADVVRVYWLVAFVDNCCGSVVKCSAVKVWLTADAA